MIGRMIPVTLKPPTSAPNNSGGEVLTYPEADWIRDRAEVIPQREAKETATGQVLQGSLLKLKMHYHAAKDITLHYRIEIEGTDYKVNTKEKKDFKNQWYLITLKALK